MKISTQEPAERPYSVQLSAAEIVGLVRFHTSQVKRITRVMGQESMKLTRGVFPVSRQLNALHDEAKRQSDAHIARARALLSIIQK